VAGGPGRAGNFPELSRRNVDEVREAAGCAGSPCALDCRPVPCVLVVVWDAQLCSSFLLPQFALPADNTNQAHYDYWFWTLMVGGVWLWVRVGRGEWCKRG